MGFKMTKSSIFGATLSDELVRQLAVLTSWWHTLDPLEVFRKLEQFGGGAPPLGCCCSNMEEWWWLNGAAASAVLKQLGTAEVLVLKDWFKVPVLELKQLGPAVSATLDKKWLIGSIAPLLESCASQVSIVLEDLSDWGAVSPKLELEKFSWWTDDSIMLSLEVWSNGVAASILEQLATAGFRLSGLWYSGRMASILVFSSILMKITGEVFNSLQPIFQDNFCIKGKSVALFSPIIKYKHVDVNI